MALPIIKDHATDSLTELITQWKDKPVVVGLLTSYMESIQQLEDTLFELLEERGVFEAIGAQLDVIGLLVGETRQSRNDDDYRQAILTRVSVNASNATPEAIMQIMLSVARGTDCYIVDHYPASFHLYVNNIVSNANAILLDSVAGAGISTRLMFDVDIQGYIGGEARLDVGYMILDDLGRTIVVDELSAEHFLITNILSQTLVTDAFLPESDEGELINPLCEVIDQTQYNVLTGLVVDENGDFILNDQGDFVRWTEVGGVI